MFKNIKFGIKPSKMAIIENKLDRICLFGGFGCLIALIGLYSVLPKQQAQNLEGVVIKEQYTPSINGFFVHEPQKYSFVLKLKDGSHKTFNYKGDEAYEKYRKLSVGDSVKIIDSTINSFR